VLVVLQGLHLRIANSRSVGAKATRAKAAGLLGRHRRTAAAQKRRCQV
jgi:hypothetical protein